MAVSDTSSRARTLCKPLSPPARLILLLSTAAVMALLYAFCAAAVVAVVLMILFDVILLLGAFRFPWLIKHLAKPLEALIRLCKAVVGSLFLRWSVEYRMSLSPKDALDLHYTVRRVANKMEVECPAEMFIDMSGTAYTELKGNKRGGRSSICFGYDLLVGLDKMELESVIAHELAHVKFARRLHRRLFVGGLSRIWRLHKSTREIIDEYARRNSKFFLASVIAKVADSLGRLANRLFATYSRQDELAADTASAVVCGTNIARDALTKIHVIDHFLRNIEWRDRVAQSEKGGSYSAWLASRLEVSEQDRAEAERRALDYDITRDYDSHPALADRLAALPDEPVVDHASSEPAVGLLADPDGVGLKLIDKIEELEIEEQRKHSRWSEKRARERTGEHHYSASQTLLIFMAIFFFGAVLFVLVAGDALSDRPFWFTVWSVGAVGSIIGLRKCKPRERLVLPAPPPGLWEKTLNDDTERSVSLDWRNEARATILANVPLNMPNKKNAALHYAKVSYDALGYCDYRTALAAAELCLEADGNCHEGLIAHSIAHKYYHNYDICTRSIKMAVHKRNVTGSLALTFGWLYMFSDRWEDAEGHLLVALKDRPDDANLLSMLAHCHAGNGKRLEAIERARRAFELAPQERSHQELLARLLVSTGKMREADAHLDALEKDGKLTVRGMLAALRTRLTVGDVQRAEEYLPKLLEVDSGGQMLLSIASAYSDADLNETAAEYYENAAQAGHWPAAYYWLAGIEHQRKDYDRAKQLLTKCMDVTREIAPDAEHPATYVEAACRAMRSMREPVDGCRAWAATVSLVDSPLEVDHVTFTIVTPDAGEGDRLLKWVYSAMHPGKELSPSMAKWQPVDDDNQPIGPTIPGIYGAEWS